MSRAAPNRNSGDEPPRLIVVTDLELAPENELATRLELALRRAMAGSVMVQLRDKAFSARRRFAFGARLSELCRRHGQRFVVNDRLDLALLLGADGVHLGEDAVDPVDARALLGEKAWVSRACHDPADAARPDDADAIVLSPIVARRKGNPPLGMDGIVLANRVLEASGQRRLVYALGGIDATTAAACVRSGAAGVAVVGAVLDGRDPAPLLTALGILRS